MKRHTHLQPLSRQHHNGLLMALLLKKGIAKQASLEEMNQFIALNWEEDLKQHFEAEENILLPALAGSSFSLDLLARFHQEHQSIRDLVEKARNNSSSQADIVDFHSILESHIRFEEKEFFPQAEALLNDEQLEGIGNALDDDRSKNCLQYPVKFWE